jgi:putative metallohydrolase (TIGR04338 family)
VFPEHFSRSDFSSIAEIQGFVNYVQLSPTWRTLGGPVGTVVKDNGDHDHSCATSENEIWISKAMRTRQTVLHELAHLTAKGEDPHGPEFTLALLMLVYNFMGKHYHSLLEEAFKRNKVS